MISPHKVRLFLSCGLTINNYNPFQMKILFISQYAGSPELGMVTRNYNWASELTRMGHDCEIIAASYSHYRNRHPQMNGQSLKSEIIDGIKYQWVKTPVYDGNSNLGRVHAILKFQWGVSRILKSFKNDYDIVIASSPHPFQIFQAKYFADRCNAKLVYDIRDLWPLTLRKLAGFSSNHPFILALQYAEKYALRHADIVTAVPQNSKKYLISKGMAPSRFLAIGNAYNKNSNTELAPLEESHKIQLQKLKNQGAILVGYTGTLGFANAMHTAIEALSKTTNSDMHLVIVGEGNRKQDLQVLAQSLNLGNRVHFLKPVPFNQIPDFLSLIDITYAGTLYSSLYKYGASLTKINDYMAASKPIIYAVGDPKNPIERSECGISCRAEDSDQIAIDMDKLASLPKEELSAIGEKGRKWLLENQTIQKQMEMILNKLGCFNDRLEDHKAS